MVVAWPTTKFLLIPSLIQGWYTKQLDFILDFSQAKVECELYMEIPKEVQLDGADHFQYILQLM